MRSSKSRVINPCMNEISNYELVGGIKTSLIASSGLFLNSSWVGLFPIVYLVQLPPITVKTENTEPTHGNKDKKKERKQREVLIQQGNF
jgi:hypothetical protein